MNDEQDTWQACPSGTLKRMVDQLDERDARAESLRQSSTALTSLPALACALFLIGVITYVVGPNRFGGVTCAQCQQQFAAFHTHLDPGAGTSEERLSTEQLQSMTVHLTECDICREKFRQQYPDAILPTPFSEDHVPGVLIGKRQSWFEPAAVVAASSAF